jgi:diguanylate cyclase (GGDEF)-like protein
MLKQLRRLLTSPGDDAEPAQARFRAFAKQMPLLYAILATNTVAVVYTLLPFGHRWVTLYAPGVLMAVCVARAVHWAFIASRPTAAPQTLRLMQSTVRLEFVLTAAFAAWGFLAIRYGDSYTQAQVVFFLALTMIGCMFCLTHLRSSALAAETQRLADENFRLANRDSLTGLANRSAFIGKTQDALNADSGSHESVAIVIVDLDGFKDVNGDFGHDVGDQLIAKVAQQFCEPLPPTGILARLGGDEFAALLSGPGAEAQSAAFAEAVGEGLAQPIMIGDHALKVRASLGRASAKVGECDGRELLRRADVAVHFVKKNGKSGVQVYDRDLEVVRRRQHALGDEIRAGLRDREFEVFYQPIVDARSKEIASVEALLRWPRRPSGAIGPDKFIPAAESSGLIDPLGLFALRRACEDVLPHAAVNLSVNVSPAQFRDPKFEKRVEEILAETRFPANRLNLEMTEGYLVDNPQRAASAIATLKSLGVSVVLDDFGSGYTSIAYLQQYGFGGIKIDRSLASRIAFDPKARVLVTGVVYLANGLDMPVTAEGVETEEQERLLRLVGCQTLQGYRFSRPKPIHELQLGGTVPSTAAVA